MSKIAYNACYGGFSLSHAAIMRYAQLAGLQLTYDKKNDVHLNGEDYFSSRDISRTDSHLIQVIEELGKAANSRSASLAIRELPAGTKYVIEKYDGNESVTTIDEFEWSVA